MIIDRIRKEHDVMIQVPSTKSGEDGGSDVITLTGYENNCLAAKDEIESIVKELVRSVYSLCFATLIMQLKHFYAFFQEDQTVFEVDIDPRVHRRLIGARGATIRRIMEQFKVDIRFPRSNDPNGAVVISGAPEDVEDARDHLLMLEEEYVS